MANYPHLVTQAWLNSQQQPGEHLVRLELHGCFNYRPVHFQGRGSKAYVFTYDPVATHHILTVPQSLWMAQDAYMARDLMLSSNAGYNLVALVTAPAATPAAATPKPLKPATKAPRVKSAEDAALAVLGG